MARGTRGSGAKNGIENKNGNSEAQYATQCQIEKCRVTYHDGKTNDLASDMILGFFGRESLLSPFLSGSLVISDSADWLNGASPIEGGEKVELEIKTPVKEEAERYEYRIWKIGNRVSLNKKQAYTLALISEEAMVNESTRVIGRFPRGGQNQDTTPEISITDIVMKLIREELKSQKKIHAQDTLFKQVILGANQRPFDIICKLANKAIPDITKTGQTNNPNSSSTTKKVIKGTAGFFFWETKRGYNFFSVDALCDEKGGVYSAPKIQTESHGIYQEKIANVEGVDARSIISKIEFTSEIDVMSALRLGKYSSNMIFFNHTTGKYDEYQYKISESYQNMAHLGNQTKVSELKAGEKALEEEPTRLMTIILDHEKWFNDPGIADSEDPSNPENPAAYADWHKYFAAQTVARKELLRNQECTIEIPGDNTICAGDKVEIEVQKKAADIVKEENPIDLESSGIYLVKDVEHAYFFGEGTSGIVRTTLQLFRDSFGVKDTDTKHGG